MNREPHSAINALWIMIIPLVIAVTLLLWRTTPADPMVADAAIATCGHQLRAATWDTHTSRDFRAIVEQAFHRGKPVHASSVTTESVIMRVFKPSS